MDAFARYLNSWAAAIAVLALCASCVDELAPIEETSSLDLVIESPSDLGSEEAPLGDGERTVKVSVTALDAEGNVDRGFSGQVDFYVQFLGGLTPDYGGDESLLAIDVTDGESGSVTLDLPPVFGQTFIWADNTRGAHPTFATGTSDILWYRDPYLEDISRPVDETALDAFVASPLEEKQIAVTHSRYGDAGRLVVTGIYAQGYTLADVECTDAKGTPPCTTGPYDAVFVFSFSRPEDQHAQRLVRGDTIARLTGAIGEFNGLTEVNFPQSFATDDDPEPARIPPPVVLDPEWVADGTIELEQLEAALIEVNDAIVCPLDDDYDTYKQWKLDVGSGCGNPVSVITEGEVSGFDPADYVGDVIPRVVGTLRPVNFVGFSIWIMYPRDADDLTLPDSAPPALP